MFGAGGVSQVSWPGVSGSGGWAVGSEVFGALLSAVVGLASGRCGGLAVLGLPGGVGWDADPR